MSKGYLGKIIRINLTNKTISIEKPDDLFYRYYMGGKGFTSYYLLNEVPVDVDAFDEKNKLIFATGVLTGVPVAGMSRYAVGAKSPLTGGYGQSESGGFWGPELKKAGYDGIIVEGKSNTPVYISIIDDIIEIKDAKHLWGCETKQSRDILYKEHDDNSVRILQIGPGSENLVRYGCIVNELSHANGRNGLGAVMGSKKLKAIVVKGTKKISFANKEKIKQIGKSFLSYYLKHPLTKSLYEFGTSGGVIGLNKGGILPTKNFIKGEFEGAEKISGQEMADTILKTRRGCYACAIRCKREVEINTENIDVDPNYGGPEYETIAAFGSLCENNDLHTIAKANELCNKYTIDTISTGMTIAFAMECYAKGIISQEDLDGIDLKFGNREAILSMIEKIAKREGVGDILAEGSFRAAKKIGKGAEKIVLCVKGQELPMHDPRGKVGVGIGYAVSETGADHMTAAHDSLLAEGSPVFKDLAELGIYKPIEPIELSWSKVRAYIYLQRWWSFFNMAGICDFAVIPRGSMPIGDVVELMKAATGWNISLWEIMKSGERSINMTRWYNIKSGFTKKDDVLPKRMHEALKNGKIEGTYIPKDKFNESLAIYYSMMGWNEDGVPTRGKLLELELDWLN